MFKRMEATFKVKRDTAFLDKGFFLDRSDYTFNVQRVLSGATSYGDCSAHHIYINGKWYARYDTRYDGIDTAKEKWLEFWKDFIEKDFGLELEIVDYSEKLEG